jgi:hypothetical protein
MHFNRQLSLALLASQCINIGLAQQLPNVDLGYETHQAISYNVSSVTTLR